MYGLEVHEYGGAAVIVRDGIAYYSDFSNTRLYKVAVKEGSQAEPVTPDNKVFRFACFDVHPTNPQILVSILEDHTNNMPSTVVNTLVIIDTEKQIVTPLVSGANFYAFPRFSPDGTKLLWQEWDHPNMPWDISKITVADISDTLLLSNVTTIFKVFKDGLNGYPKYDIFTKKTSPIFSSLLKEEFAPAMWKLSFFPLAIIDEEGNFAMFKAFRDGRAVLYQVDIEMGDRKELESPYVVMESMHTISKSKGQFVFLGIKADKSERIILGSAKTDASSFTSIVASTASPSPFDPNLHVGSSIDGEKPPCVVNVHGGPTGMAYPGLNWAFQYWTSQGFAWLDVNYGGSYGYGKDYMNCLHHGWGVVDIEDCITASQLLSSPPHSLINLKQIIICGRSYGGLTVLGALCNSSNTSDTESYLRPV
ncbi:hypothetical protein BT96DRAFT_1005365 [Gymnopus androsaceus JB14]|uniref:Peptidase S9 prolyl oligopeptidase catalytic domain-containing protein n=1 Tax=Gymnopus androsaceus JB14 TaxID=1447944 RepID=A0A6A4GPM2_9AGAR|nr:hypothetical protein BT96DRAFT_1005365 [Gymnopus androsaceus JB14]